MSQFPVEIWLKITEQACTDGGSTGCALQRVSKWMAEISDQCRLNSVALTSVKQLHSFSVYVQKRPKLSCKILHLFISLVQAFYQQDGVETVTKLTSRGVHVQHTRELFEHALRLLLAVLRLVSSDLRTLSLLLPQNLCFFRPSTLPTFPALCELTFAGDHVFLGSVFPALQINFPLLERLHIIDIYRSLTIAEYLSQKIVAPSLAQVRLSGPLTIGPRDGPWDLPFTDSLLVNPLDTLDEQGRGEFIQTWTRFIDEIRNRSIALSIEMSEALMIQDIVEIIRRAEKVELLSIEVRQGITLCEYWTERCDQAKRDWIDRINGGPGCWVAEERENRGDGKVVY